MDLSFTNTKTRKKERFTPLDPKNVRMYVCGPTVYDRAHLGNARPVIVFDLLYRLLRHVYGAEHVTYVRNFTDVDDKINARAAESGRSIGEITEETIQWYLDDMGAVGALEPTHMPRATAYIPEMIAMIEDLIAKGHAYEAEGHVLFAVESYTDYGKLSGRAVEDMIAGARVEVAPYKRNPMDFVLWKPSEEGLPGWDSPWGRGRPGWHIECSAMADALLGAEFDIHGGGNDLMFPHHENEIAQSCCAHEGAGFAQVWLHNEMLQVEGKKMSKSLGNFFTVRDLLDGGIKGQPKHLHGSIIRYVFLQSHYRKPMDWRSTTAHAAIQRMRIWASELESAEHIKDEFRADREAFMRAYVPDEIVLALADDINSPLALNHLIARGKMLEGQARAILLDHEIEAAQAVLLAGCELLGLDLLDFADFERRHFSESQVDLEVLATQLVAARATAMETKDFSEVDRLKTALIAAGVEVRMSKAGVELVPGPDFDAGKLEGIV